MGWAVWVGSIQGYSSRAVSDFFRHFGKISSCRIGTTIKGEYAIVVFEDKEAAMKALDANGMDWNGQKIVVALSTRARALKEGTAKQGTGSRSICKLYVEGHCKYGTRCWNIHHKQDLRDKLTEEREKSASQASTTSSQPPAVKALLESEWLRQVRGHLRNEGPTAIAKLAQQYRLPEDLGKVKYKDACKMCRLEVDDRGNGDFLISIPDVRPQERGLKRPADSGGSGRTVDRLNTDGGSPSAMVQAAKALAPDDVKRRRAERFGPPTTSQGSSPTSATCSPTSTTADALPPTPTVATPRQDPLPAAAATAEASLVTLERMSAQSTEVASAREGETKAEREAALAKEELERAKANERRLAERVERERQSQAAQLELRDAKLAEMSARLEAVEAKAAAAAAGALQPTAFAALAAAREGQEASATLSTMVTAAAATTSSSLANRPFTLKFVPNTPNQTAYATALSDPSKGVPLHPPE